MGRRGGEASCGGVRFAVVVRVNGHPACVSPVLLSVFWISDLGVSRPYESQEPYIVSRYMPAIGTSHYACWIISALRNSMRATHRGAAGSRFMRACRHSREGGSDACSRGGERALACQVKSVGGILRRDVTLCDASLHGLPLRISLRGQCRVPSHHRPVHPPPSPPPRALEAAWRILTRRAATGPVYGGAELVRLLLLRVAKEQLGQR